MYTPLGCLIKAYNNSLSIFALFTNYHSEGISHFYSLWLFEFALVGCIVFFSYYIAFGCLTIVCNYIAIGCLLYSISIMIARSIYYSVIGLFTMYPMLQWFLLILFYAVQHLLVWPPFALLCALLRDVLGCSRLDLTAGLLLSGWVSCSYSKGPRI